MALATYLLMGLQLNIVGVNVHRQATVQEISQLDVVGTIIKEIIV